MDDETYWRAVGRVKRVIAESKDIKFLFVLRVFLVLGRIKKESLTETMNCYIHSKADNDKTQKNIPTEYVPLSEHEILKIIDELVRKDLVFDPKEYYYDEYWIKEISSPWYIEPSGKFENDSEDLIYICANKITELSLGIPVNDYVLIDESGGTDDGMVSLKIYLIDENTISLKFYDNSSPHGMSLLDIAISKDEFAPKEKREYSNYEGDKPEFVDQNPLGIYKRSRLSMPINTAHLNLNIFGDGIYRITTEALWNNVGSLSSIFVFKIKDGRISSIKEEINSTYFYVHHYAHITPECDVEPKTHTTVLSQS